MPQLKKEAYKVIRPIGLGGRREVGECIYLTDEEAKNIGSQYVEALNINKDIDMIDEQPVDGGAETPAESTESVSDQPAGDDGAPVAPEATPEAPAAEETPAA